MSRTAATKWTLDDTALPCSDDTIDPTLLDRAKSTAQDWLYGLSGGRVGVFSTVDDQYRVAPVSADRPTPYKDEAGLWRNGLLDDDAMCRIELFRQPVRGIVAVRVNGETLDPSEYVLEGNTLVRLGAQWPVDCDCCTGAPISVDYRWGVEPDALAIAAFGELTCEVVAALTPGSDCRLPGNATKIVRQGVEVTRPSLETLTEHGLTGLPLVDQFVRVHNPNHLRARSRVIALDGARRAV